MGLRNEIERRIEKKQSEIDMFEKEIRRYQTLVAAAASYIQALEDMERFIPSDGNGLGSQITLRPGTAIYKAREAILAAGGPVQIDELLKAIGKSIDAENRGALS